MTLGKIWRETPFNNVYEMSVSTFVSFRVGKCKYRGTERQGNRPQNPTQGLAGYDRCEYLKAGKHCFVCINPNSFT
jgi:hypothetical protein